VHHEHRRRDPAAALEAAEAGLELLAERDAPLGVLRDFEHRRQRLLRKLARA
jgi:hypothetical protein